MKKILMMLAAALMSTFAIAKEVTTYWNFFASDPLKDGYTGKKLQSAVMSGATVYFLFAEGVTVSGDVSTQINLLNALRDGSITVGDIATMAKASAVTDASGKVESSNGASFEMPWDDGYKGKLFFYEVVVSPDEDYVYISLCRDALPITEVQITANVLTSSYQSTDLWGDADFSSPGWYAISAKPKVTLDEIIEGEDWTTFDVAYTLDKLEEGVDYKVLIDVTAGGVTKTITNTTDIVIGSFTNTVDTVELFGGKVFDEKAKVTVSLGTWKELKWTQLWENGPYFAEYNVGATKPEDVGKTYTFAELEGLVKAPMRVPNWDDISKLEFANNTVNVTWDGAKKGAKITGLGNYASNSIFLPATSDDRPFYWSSTDEDDDKKAFAFTAVNDAGVYKGSKAFISKTEKCGVRAVVDPENVDSVRQILDPVSTAEDTVELLAPPVVYLDWDGAKFVTATNRTYDVVTAETATFGKGWYIVTNTIERAGIKVNGDAHLILCDGASLKVKGDANKAGIEVPADKSLTIYGQSEGTGKLEASSALLGAGIGGSSQGSCGAITINGGTITANGGPQGAGIGGGYGVNGGMLTINGGTVTSNGGNRAAGIGGGNNGNGGTVTINGGTVTANGNSSAGIGGGRNSSSAGTVTFGTAMASKYVWAGASATACEGMTTAAFSSDHSAAYVELPVDCYTVTYDGNGAAGVMTNSVFAVSKEVALKKNAFTAVGYTFQGWTTNGTDVAYTDETTDTDFADKNETLDLTAKWELDTNGVKAEDFASFTNMLATAEKQSASLPVTIGFTSGVAISEGETVTLPSGSCGFSGIKYVGDEEVGSNLELDDGVLYGDVLRGEVTVDALRLMRYAMGGSISSFQAISEGETTVTNAVVMLLGDNGKAYFNDTDDVDEMINDILAADPRPTTLKLYEVKGAIVTFEAMGGTIGSGTDPLGNDYDGGVESVTYLCMPDSGYQLPGEVTREGYTLKGWFDGWTNGDNEITNDQEIVDYSEHSLYAQWTSTAPVQSEEGELHFADIVDDEPVKEIAEKEYATNTELKVVTTPLYLEKIGQRAFLNCSAMESLTLTATRDYATLEPTTLEIDTMAFAGCTAIEELIIGGKVKLGAGAFQNCATLKKIIFLGDEEIEYADYALYLAGTKNGTGELKVYMSKDFQDNNSTLVADFAKWNSAVTIVSKVDTKPVDGIGEISLDPSAIVPGKTIAIIVQTTSNGKPDVDDVDIEYSTDLTNWSKLTEGTVKTAYPDGTVMIEVVVPNETTCFFRAVVE